MDGATFGAPYPPSLPSGDAFNFYLEAKRTNAQLTADRLEGFLLGASGLSRLFRDFAKGKPGKVTHTSPYETRSGRKHEHFVIGMLVFRLKPGERDTVEIKKQFDLAVGRRLECKKKDIREGENDKKKRTLKRLPTVALVVTSTDDKVEGMMAVFTVIGATKALRFKATAPRKP